MNPKHFGAAIRAQRCKLRKSQRTVADLAGITSRTLIKIEGGESVPRLFPAWRICRALGLSLDAVLQEVKA